MRYFEGAVVAAVNQVCRDGNLCDYENDDQFLALILCLMCQGFGGGADRRYGSAEISVMLDALRNFGSEELVLVFGRADLAKSYLPQIADGNDVSDGVLAEAIAMLG